MPSDRFQVGGENHPQLRASLPCSAWERFQRVASYVWYNRKTVLDLVEQGAIQANLNELTPELAEDLNNGE
jgi:hypothetical protein